MEPIKIGFTGNRNGLRPDQEEAIIKILDKYNNVIVSHGDCVGSDTDFHKLCIKYKANHLDKTISIHIFPPSNSTLRGFNVGDLVMGEKPYLERNLNILKNSSMLIACPTDKNKEELRSGT
jgi:hypothetical protein